MTGNRNSSSLTKKIGSFFHDLSLSHRMKTADLTMFEARELENIFVLLLMGAFIGIPSPPSSISAELLPLLRHEIKIFNRRAQDASDALGELMGLLDMD